MIRSLLLWSLVTLSSLLAPSRVEAHALGQSYVFLQVLRTGIGGRVEMTLSDLDDALGLDRDRDGKVSSSELEEKAEAARKYIDGRLRFVVGESRHGVRFTRHEVLSVPLGQFVQFHFVLDGITEPPPTLDVEASFLFDTDPRHVVILMVEYNQLIDLVNETEIISLVFDADRQRRTLDLMVDPAESEFIPFLRQGIWNFWTGIDHVLFLLVLLLYGVLTRQGDHLRPVTSSGPAVLHAARVFALFTVAHSITLGLASLQIVELPWRWAGAISAASVVLAALNGFWPLFPGSTWWIVFGFGLFHGFGFAGTLSRLVTPESSVAETLLGFNVGLEIGQIALIVVALSILYSCRRVQLYRRVLVPSAATVIVLVALMRLIGHAFDMEWMPL